MKAICLLICLALARDISGSIFQYRRPAKNPEVRRYFDESRESVNEKQYRSRKEQLNQQWSDEEQRVYQQPQYQQREDYPQSQYKQRKEYQQPQYKQRKEYQQPQYIYREYSEPQFQNIEYSRFQDKAKNSKHSLNQANLPYPKPSRGYQQHELVFKDKGFNHEQKTVPTVTRYADSVSESKESVSNENIVNLMQFPGADQFAQPRFADMGMASPVYRSMNQDVMFGDAVVWRGIQLAADPKNLVSEKDIKNIYIEAQKTLKHIDPETKNKLHKTLDTAIQANIEDTHLNATELLKKHQYPVEEHTIKTEDGYLLTLFRIPPKQAAGEIKQRPVVFLMHGLLGSADDWLLMGPQKSLAYILWDAGFDVWLGNGRGNRYSKHVSNHREQDEFWQYSNDEIALFDLPAMIDYVLQTSKQEKMVFIAHSLGTTAFFSLAATKPSYNEKIVMMYALAPMAYMGNVRSPMIRMIAPTSPLYERLHKQLGHGEFKPNKDLIHTLGGESCMNEIDCKHLCSNVYAVMTSVNVDHLNTSVIPMILSHLPAGASTKQMMHYGQAVASHEFRMYDYGAEVNQKVYNDIVPPKYDMTAVTAPVALYYSESDWLAHPKDVKRLEKELPNVVDEYKIPQDYFTHMDFQFSNKALEVYEKLIASILQNYSY